MTVFSNGYMGYFILFIECFVMSIYYTKVIYRLCVFDYTNTLVCVFGCARMINLPTWFGQNSPMDTLHFTLTLFTSF